MKRIFLVSLLVVMAGCAAKYHIPQYPTPKPDEALIVFYRPTGGPFAGHGGLDVQWDRGTFKPQRSGTYQFVTVLPGEHHFKLEGLNKADLTLNVTPGKRYFVRYGLRFGLIGPNAYIERVFDEEGEKAITTMYSADVKFKEF